MQLFEDRKVRTVWDDEKEKWYFSVVDFLEVLTASVNPTDYLKKMCKRVEELNLYIVTNCPQIGMKGAIGKLAISPLNTMSLLPTKEKKRGNDE